MIPPPKDEAAEHLAALMNAEVKAAEAKKEAISRTLQKAKEMAAAQKAAVQAMKENERQAWATADVANAKYQESVAQETQKMQTFVANVTSSYEALIAASKLAFQASQARADADTQAQLAEERLKGYKNEVASGSLDAARSEGYSAGAKAQTAQDMKLAQYVNATAQKALAEAASSRKLKNQADEVAKRSGAVLAAYANEYPADSSQAKLIQEALHNYSVAIAVIADVQKATAGNTTLASVGCLPPCAGARTS